MHADGDYHSALHLWIYIESTGELLLWKWADSKDSWPGLWDISSAGHISAGDTSLITARQGPCPAPFVCVCMHVSDSHKVMTALIVILPSIFLFVEILLEFHRLCDLAFYCSDRQELQEELGITLPSEAFELLFVYLQQW